MRYHSKLIEGTFLRRPINFLIDIVLQSKKRITLRCPNLGPLTACDILGTQLWFSAPSQGHYLPTLELVEVNGGFLVGVNPEIILDLVIEAITKGYIVELSGYEISPKKNKTKTQLYNWEVVELRNKLNHKKCYVCLQHVIYTNENFEALFPIDNQHFKVNLDYLALRHKQGNRSMMIFCVLHSGANIFNITSHQNSLCFDKLSFAINQGVEFVAYKAMISPHEIELSVSLPPLANHKLLKT